MHCDNHKYLHQEAGDFAKRLKKSLNEILDIQQYDTNDFASCLSYIRMKASEVVNNSDDLLIQLGGGNAKLILDVFITLKSNIDFFIEEADKVNKQLIDIINHYSEIDEKL